MLWPKWSKDTVHWKIRVLSFKSLTMCPDRRSKFLHRIYTRAKVEYSNAVWLRQTRDFATQQAAYVTDL